MTQRLNQGQAAGGEGLRQTGNSRGGSFGVITSQPGLSRRLTDNLTHFMPWCRHTMWP